MESGRTKKSSTLQKSPVVPPPSSWAMDEPIATAAATPSSATPAGTRRKTRLCHRFMASGHCRLNERCRYAHGYGELVDEASNGRDGGPSPPASLHKGGAREHHRGSAGEPAVIVPEPAIVTPDYKLVDSFRSLLSRVSVDGDVQVDGITELLIDALTVGCGDLESLMHDMFRAILIDKDPVAVCNRNYSHISTFCRRGRGGSMAVLVALEGELAVVKAPEKICADILKVLFRNCGLCETALREWFCLRPPDNPLRRNCALLMAWLDATVN